MAKKKTSNSKRTAGAVPKNARMQIRIKNIELEVLLDDGAPAANTAAPSHEVVRLWKVGADGRVLADDAKEWEGVYDASTRLIWGRRLLAGEHIWADAMKAAATATLCGQPARAPTIQERISIVDYSRTEPSLNVEFFDRSEKNGWEWTSTPAAAPSGVAWYVYLGGGYSGRGNQSVRAHVRAVRAGQPLGFSF